MVKTRSMAKRTTGYYPYKINLCQGQLEKLKRAIKNRSSISLRLNNKDLSGNHQLLLTERQINKIKKHMSKGVGMELRLSKAQISKNLQSGGSVLSSLLQLGSKMLPYATQAISKVAPALATGAAQVLGSLGINKIFGGFMIPQNKIDQLIKYKNLLSQKQKEDIMKALQSGGRLIIKPTKVHSGGFLGTLLASIGIPLALKALTGGTHTAAYASARGKGLQVPPKTRAKGLPSLMPPPFVGTWDKTGYGKKKSIKSREPFRQRLALPPGERFTTRRQQPIQEHSSSGSNSLKFSNHPLSNHGLLQWCDKLGIKICGIYSRNEYMPKKHSPCIINLDDLGNQGTHWVCCFPSLTIANSLNYFDSFGMPYPEEYAKRAKKDNLQIIYNTSQYQELTSVLCGYYCLFVLHRAMVFN